MNQNVRTCFLSFFLTFLLLFPCSMIITNLIVQNSEPNTSEQVNETMNYQPTKEEDLTILITVTPGRPEPADVFCLLRISPHDNSVSLSLLPNELTSTLGSKMGTLEELYDYGGIDGAREAVENLFFIEIDRTVQFDNEGLSAVIDYLGGVPFTMPEALSFSEEDAPITIPAGRQLIDGARFCTLLRSDYALPLLVALAQERLTPQLDLKALISFLDEESVSTLTAYDAASHQAGWEQMIRMQNATLISPPIQTENYQGRERITQECRTAYQEAYE